jgi:hypothetical protein
MDGKWVENGWKMGGKMGENGPYWVTTGHNLCTKNGREW